MSPWYFVSCKSGGKTEADYQSEDFLRIRRSRDVYRAGRICTIVPGVVLRACDLRASHRSLLIE